MKKYLSWLFAYLGFFLSVLPTVCVAKGLDCNRLATKGEEIICGSAVLTRLSDEMYALLNRKSQDLNGPPWLFQEQRLWERQERNYCTSAECAAKLLIARSKELRKDLRKLDLSSIPVAASSWEEVATLLEQERNPPRPAHPGVSIAQVLPEFALVKSPATAPPLLDEPYDCSRAFFRVEKLICSSPALRALELEVLLLYARSKEDSRSRDSSDAKHSQHAWYTLNLSPCTDVLCVAKALQERARWFRHGVASLDPRIKAIPVAFASPQALEDALRQEQAAASVLKPLGVDVTNQRPSNPGKHELCSQPPFSESRYLVCDTTSADDPIGFLQHHRSSALQALGRLKPSVRPASPDAVLAPSTRFLEEALSSCPKLEYTCLDKNARQATTDMERLVRQLQDTRAVAEEEGAKREQARIAQLPLHVRGELGNTGRLGEVALWVTNRTKLGLTRIQVACTLHQYYPTYASGHPILTKGDGLRSRRSAASSDAVATRRRSWRAA